MYNKPIPILLLTDFYKTCHRAFYNPGTSQLVSYWTPRKDRTERVGYVVMFWLQVYIKTYLFDRFEETFFSRPWEDVRKEYVDYISATFDPEIAEDEIEAFKAIHELGYLPIEIRAVPEGTRVPIGCPMIEIRATEEWAFWVGEYFETVASCNLWGAITAATIADDNRQLLDKWYNKTVDDDVPRSKGAGNFSMRGMFGEDAAIMADAGHLLSFSSTATVPTMWVLHNLYHADYGVGKGTPSTEHSVMESYGQDGEFEAYRHIATEVRPNGVLSMVSDTWNLWKVIDDYVSELKPKLMERDGKVVIRPDSGNPADILCGSDLFYLDLMNYKKDGESDMDALRRYVTEDACKHQTGEESGVDYHFQTDDFIVTAEVNFATSDEGGYEFTPDEVHVNLRFKTTEEKGVIYRLWEIFGGKVNSKGYRVLDSHIGAIYGDAITHAKEEEIFSRLATKKFASNNVVLGFGSYTYQYVTRDTFGFALKVTHGIVNGIETPMFKDPITDKGKNSAGKKSQKGMCIVRMDENGSLSYTDGHTMAEADNAPDNIMRTVFKNGQLLIDESFETIRKRLHPDF